MSQQPWRVLNSFDRLDLLIVECAFPEKDRQLSKRSKHYCPSLLAQDMAKLDHRPKTCITHLKPGAEAPIFEEIRNALPSHDVCRLQGGEVFQL